jgi:YegS/Rv2252/BmrU family lipid kinase
VPRTVFLVNPASDNGRTGSCWAELAHRAATVGLEGEARFSERPFHLAELARAAADDGAELLVAVGGDGTVNEVVNGIMAAARGPELAVLPIGTGMDFVRTYGIPRKVERAARVALEGDVRTIDVGRARFRTWAGDEEARHFANVASVGMSAAVAQRANGMSKAFGGRVTFYYALVRTFLEWRNGPISLDVDGERREARMHDVVVANGQWHGGAMWLAPQAEPDDGLFDVLAIGDITKADFIRSSHRIYRGTHLTHPKIELLRGARVVVDAPEHLPIELDGEQVGTTPVVFEVLPRALRLRVPGA